MRLVLYLALLCTCYFLAIGISPVVARRQKCYYVDENNNRLWLVSYQRGSKNHKSVKELDNKHQKHPKSEENVDILNAENVGMSQTVYEPKNHSHHDISRPEHHNRLKVGRSKDTLDKHTPENEKGNEIHQSKSEHKNKTEVDPKIEIVLKHEPKSDPKDDFEQNKRVKSEPNSTKDPTILKDNSTEPKDNQSKIKDTPIQSTGKQTNPKDNQTKSNDHRSIPARVHYHPKPSDSSLNIKSSPKIHSEHPEDKADTLKHKNAPNKSVDSKKSKIVEKSKKSHISEPAQANKKSKKSHSLQVDDSKHIKDQVKDENLDSKHKSDKNSAKNVPLEKDEFPQERSKKEARPHLEHTDSKDQNSEKSNKKDQESNGPDLKDNVPRNKDLISNSTEDSNLKSTDEHQKPKHVPKPTDDKQSHSHTKSNDKNPTLSEFTPTLSKLESNKIHHEAYQPTSDDSANTTLVHHSLPLIVNTSETEMKDIQKEISHVIAFLQKLVTYGPIVNPKAYTKAPKCPEYSEKKKKCDSSSRNDLKNRNNDSKPKKLEIVEPDLDVGAVQPVLKQHLIEPHVDIALENVEQMPAKETVHDSPLEALESLSNTSAAPIASSQQTNEQNIELLINSSEKVHDLDQAGNKGNSAIASDSKSQPQREVQENNSTNGNIPLEISQQPRPSNQPELNNQSLNPIIDKKQHENALLEVANSSDPLHNPKFETILAPNSAHNHTEGSKPQNQSEMIPTVVSNQSKENLNDSAAPVSQISDSATSENSEIDTKSSEPEPTTEADENLVTIDPTVQEEAVESSIQVEPSTQSPAPATTPANPWLMHIFGKFSHLVYST
ncbi:hypothetical protein ACKWTF_015743 [Chironomus riparius]